MWKTPDTRAMDNPIEWLDVYNNWIRYMPNAVMRDVPGTHYKVLKDPYVRAVAEHIVAVNRFAAFKTTNIPSEGVCASELQVQCRYLPCHA
jgi:hypothetical protein